MNEHLLDDHLADDICGITGTSVAAPAKGDLEGSELMAIGLVGHRFGPHSVQFGYGLSGGSKIHCWLPIHRQEGAFHVHGLHRAGRLVCFFLVEESLAETLGIEGDVDTALRAAGMTATVDLTTLAFDDLSFLAKEEIDVSEADARGLLLCKAIGSLCSPR